MAAQSAIFLFIMTTAIISALPDEQAGLAALLHLPEELTAKPRSLQRGFIHDQAVILALAGIGKVAAATTATLLIERHAVKRIVFTGVAGGVASHVQVGDVVVGNAYLQHDMDASPLFPRHEVPLYGRSRFDADAGLIAMLLEATKTYFTGASGHIAHPNFNTYCGLILSGDRFVSRASEVQTLRRELPEALCVEMESAAIAQVCHDYQLPFAAIRSISDQADDSASVDFPKFVAQVAGPYAVGIMDAFMRRLAMAP
jgi:adenosylhomocysteine nucleosidase